MGEKVIQGLLAFCGLLSVLTTTAIVFSLIGPTIGFFELVDPIDFLTGTDWSPSFEPASFGVLPIVVGTLSVTLWGMVFAIPIGLGAAIYLREYASPRVRKIVKPVLEILVGIPTVAIGFFAVTFILPSIIQPLWPDGFLGGDQRPFMALAAGLGIGLMIVPIIASISDDAMRAVPAGLREGAYALGSTKLEGRDQGRLPGRPLRDRRLDRARDLPRRRRDDDRPPRRGLDPQPDLQPGRVDPGDDLLHRDHGDGRHLDRIRRLQDDLRRRHRALPDDPGDEHDLDPPRAQVPGGVRVMEAGNAPTPERVRLAVAGARSTTEAMLTNQPRGDVIRNNVFAVLLLIAVVVPLIGLARPADPGVRAREARRSAWISSPTRRRRSTSRTPASARRSSDR